MPEGNEIHRWAERHYAAFGGKAVRVDGRDAFGGGIRRR